MNKLGILALLSLYSASAANPVIIDTDAGTDNLMAIAFLLARRDVTVEAITIANGLAHVPNGAANIVRLIALSGRPDIPVYRGKDATENHR